MLLVAFGLGGGESQFGLANLAVQLTALGVLALRERSSRRFWRDAPLFLRILVVLSLLLPVAQVIPLPEHVWSALPGRDLVARAYDAAGTGGWMTLSVNPLQTLLALTALITPLP